MNNANELVEEAVGVKLLDPLPARVRDIFSDIANRSSISQARFSPPDAM